MFGRLYAMHFPDRRSVNRALFGPNDLLRSTCTVSHLNHTVKANLGHQCNHHVLRSKAGTCYWHNMAAQYYTYRLGRNFSEKSDPKHIGRMINIQKETETDAM